MMKQMLIVCALLFSCLVPSSYAVNRNWTAAGGTSDWFNSANWSGAPAGVPSSGDSARLGVSATAPASGLWPNYNGDNSASPPSSFFTIGQAINASFTMTGGTFVQNGSSVTLGNGALTTGTWTHNGGNFTANTSPFNIGWVASSAGNLTMNGGSITVNSLTLANGASATANLTLNSGLFYVNGTSTINNSSKTGTAANLTIGNGATFDGNKMDFNKGTMTILGGGTVRLRGPAAVTPLSIRSENILDLAGGDLFVGMDYTGTGTVEGWISGGRLITTLPGAYVTYAYDGGTGFSHIFAVVPEPTSLGLLALGFGLMLARRRLS